MRNAVHTPLVPHTNDRLGIKAAWNPQWKERAFERCFYSLDKITINLAFSTAGPASGEGETGGRKRRRLY